MVCAACGEAFRPRQRAEAAITVLAQGDAVTFSYWSCPTCRHFTVEVYRESFLGEDEAWTLPPVSRDVGERCVALVAACPSPSDKLCNCLSHRALYHGLPKGDAR